MTVKLSPASQISKRLFDAGDVEGLRHHVQVLKVNAERAAVDRYEAGADGYNFCASTKATLSKRASAAKAAYNFGVRLLDRLTSSSQ